MNSLDITKEAAVAMVPVMNADGLQALEFLVENNRCKTFLEIGTAIGRTAVRMAELGLQVTTIERDPALAAKARANIEKSGLGSKITLIEADARDAEVSGTFDCIFIDAAKSQYKRFFLKYSPHVSDNGIIVSDNMLFHGMVQHPEMTDNRHTKGLIRRLRDYRTFLEENTDYQTEFLDDTGDGLAVSRRKPK